MEPRDWDDGAYTGFGDSLWAEDDPAPAWEPTHPNTALRDTHKLAKVLDGECAMPGCRGLLDDSFYCQTCGQVQPPSRFAGKAA